MIEESECKVGQDHDTGDDERPRSTSEGTISVVIIPSITPQHLKYINEKTYFYKVSNINDLLVQTFHKWILLSQPN